MRRTTLALILILTQLLLTVSTGTQPVSAAAPFPGGPINKGEVQNFLDGAFAAQMKADHVPGAVVAVIDEGEVIYLHGYGYADLNNQVPVDPQKTLFRLGSVSKLFTWTAVMQLVEQGKLSLDADINTYLDFKIPDTYPQPITLRHLMSHTPGFEDASRELFTLNIDRIPTLGDYLRTHIPARVYPPGTVSAYSNFGAATAGYIVERVSGMPFSAYVEKNIFQPLGMAHSSFIQPLPDALAADTAYGYNYVGGNDVAGSFEIVPGYPAGGLSATADDMTRFMIAHLQRGRYGDARILSEATALQMQQPLFSQDPSLHGMAYGFFEDRVNGQATLSHGGDTLLFHTGLYLLTNLRIGIFISTNGVNGSTTQRAIFQAFMDHFYPVPARSAAMGFTDFDTRAPLYAGEYYLTRSNFSTIEKFFRLINKGTLSVDLKGKNVFLSGITPSPIRYRETEPGRLVADEGPVPILVLHQDLSGQVYLYTTMPFTLVKAPWYATAAVQMIIFVGGALLFLLTLIAWGRAWLRSIAARLSHGGPAEPPNPLGAKLARAVAGLYMLFFLLFLAGFGWIASDILPAFGVPRMIFETTLAMDIVFFLPAIAGVLGVLTLPFAVLAWRNGYWSVRSRLWFTLLALWIAVDLWAMVYWKMLL